MKNFTNNFKQFTSRLSARWLIMALMLLLGTGSAWAVNIIQGNCDIYFDNSKTQWTDACIQFVIGHNSYSRTYTMTKQSNSNLYHVKLGTENIHKWNDATYYAFIGTSSKWGDGSWGPGNIANATHRTTTYTGKYDLKSGSSYYFVPTSSGDANKNGASFEIGTSYTQTYTVNKSETGGEGTVTLGGTAITTGGVSISSGSKALTITAPTGYNVSSVTVSGGTLTAGTTGSNTYSGTVNVTAATTISVEYVLACQISTSITSAELQPNGTISLAGNFTTCGAKYHGFQWRKVGSNWCGETDYANNEESNYVVLGNYDVNGSETGSFTPKDAGTYEFRTYIATTSPWLYSTSPIEVSTCVTVEVPDITSNSPICSGLNLTLTLNERQDDVVYKIGNQEIFTEGNNTYSFAPQESGTLTVVASHTNACNGATNQKEIQYTVNPLPDAPSLANPAPVCEGTTVNLPIGYNWYNTETGGTEVQNTAISVTGTYWAAAVQNGCESATRTRYDVTVNPKPTISISGKETAVLYEDVTLIAEAPDAEIINWSITSGDGELSATTGTSVVLTSSTAGTVTVTATATSEDGCTSAATKTVTFSAEVCNNVADMTKIYFDTKGNSNFNDNVYLSVAGNTYNKNRSADCKDTGHAGDYWPGEDGTFHKMTKIAGTNIYYVNKPASILSGKISIWNKNQQGNDNVWQAHVILAKSIDNNNNCLVIGSSNYHIDRESNVYCSTWTTYKDAPAITAPAVKTVSVTSDEDGNVTMVGQVVKTGCDTQAILGLQYKKQKQDGTYDDNYTTYPNPGTKEAISAGKTFTVTTKLEDGTYKIRARIDNSHATNGYGEDIIVVVNTVKTPISNVAINYSDIKGTIIANPNPMCKGATAYVKLDYTGSKYSDIKWLVEGVETNLVTDKGNGVWSYEIQGDGSLSVELKNDANTDPAWPYSNKLPFSIIPVPTAPYISIDPASGVICQDSYATIKVENPSTACSYKLVEEQSKADFTPYTSGDLIYKVQNVAKYYVVAQHNACTDNEYTSNQVAINQIISTNATISIEPNDPKTTPWEPVTITVNPQEGYVYELTYTDNNLAGVNGVRIKQNGDSYTYYIPRPDAWTTGDSNPVRTPINYGIKAQLKVDGEASQCQLNAATATIQLKDEDNENCPNKQEP